MSKRFSAVVVVLVVAAGCAGATPTDDADPPDVSETTPGSTPGPGSGDPTVAADPAAETTTTTEAVAALSDFPLDEAEVACVVDRLDLPADEIAGIPAAELRAVVDDCVQIETFAPALTGQLAADFPGVYTDDQLACIEQQYVALSAEDLSALTVAGLNPTDDVAASSGAAVLSAMFGACGTVPPADL